MVPGFQKLYHKMFLLPKPGRESFQDIGIAETEARALQPGQDVSFHNELAL